MRRKEGDLMWKVSLPTAKGWNEIIFKTFPTQTILGLCDNKRCRMGFNILTGGRWNFTG